MTTKPVADMTDAELFGEWEGLILSVALGTQIAAPGPTDAEESRIAQIEQEMERRGILP